VCKGIKIFNPKFLHLIFFADKKNKTKEAVTIAYCLFPTPTKRLFVASPNYELVIIWSAFIYKRAYLVI